MVSNGMSSLFGLLGARDVLSEEASPTLTEGGLAMHIDEVSGREMGQK